MAEVLTWDIVKKELDAREERVLKNKNAAVSLANRYVKNLNNPEKLNQILAMANNISTTAGNLQAELKEYEGWTDKRWEVEKALEKVRKMEANKISASAADAYKYQDIQPYLDILVRAASLHLMSQNAKTSAKGTADSIRSRLSWLKDTIRSS